jgi:parallel beta-helix repeat protein
MNRLSLKFASSMALIFIIVNILFAAFNVQRAEASGTIYVRANGLVEGTDKVVSLDNVTYTFTDDIVNQSVVVERDNIVVDGLDHTVQGSGASFLYSKGIELVGRNNITIKNMKIKGFFWGVYLSSSSNNTLSGNNIKNNSYSGITLEYSSNNSVAGNNIENNTYGIYLYQSSNNGISGNNIKNNSFVGIYLWFSSNNNISEDMITNSSDGIDIEGSSNNTISGESIANNNIGIVLYSSSNYIVISENNIIDNSEGIELWVSSNGSFFHNNFINNTQQAHIAMFGYSNSWGNGYPSGGNYWSDYKGTDSDYDGIGDTSYVIDDNNQDNYPLMGMFSSFNTSYGYSVDFVSNSSISYVQFVVSGSIEHPEYPPVGILFFNVSGATSTQGFVRVCIPKVLINGSYILWFDGHESTTYPHLRELPCSNETYGYLYINYTHSEHDIMVWGTTMIPEFPSFPILLLFMLETLSAIIFYGRKRTKIIFNKTNQCKYTLRN